MTRSRVRAIDTADSEARAQVPNPARQLIRQIYQANQDKNAATRTETKGRKELLAMMLDAKVGDYQIQTEFGDKKLTLSAKVETGDLEHIDVAKLRELVGDALFMNIVSATKTAIKEHAGEHVLAQVTKVEKGKGTTSVKVGLVK